MKEKDFITIDVTMFNYQKLESISNDLDIEYSILKYYKEGGAVKLIFSSESKELIAYTTKFDRELLITTQEYSNFMLSLDVYNPKKKMINIDSILDKISKFGIKSLNKNELNILKSV